MIRRLEWFPKRFSPGDMDASGGDRLLGKTELSRLAVLIRETAQNSWDARVGDGRPLFGVNLRRTDFRLREELVDLLSEGGSVGLGGLRRQANFRLLEIYDRGTHGLDGPADLSPPGKGRSARFQDLILKFGVSHNNGTTGGTYGFGKTAAYAYSGIGTVIYWTRCRNLEGELEDRFIASAFGESYQERGIQYTGRHWWGERSEDGESVLPIIGSAAAELGSRFFERGFEPGETGTSILVLDPLAADEEDSEVASEDPLDRHRSSPVELEEDFTRRARHAIRANLWPKMVSAPGRSEPPMRLELSVNGHLVDLGHSEGGALRLWGAALNAIRAARAGLAEVRSPLGNRIELVEITRNKKIIGHLAVVRRIPAAEPWLDLDDLDPAREDQSRMYRTALMRGQAELVVTTVDWIQREAPTGTDWLAVYKSADDFDEYYADAEPPAHDSWVTEGSSSESSKIVRHTKIRVRQNISSLIFPQVDAPAPEASAVLRSTGALSRRLGAILPGPAMQPSGASSGGSRGGRRRAEQSSRWVIEAESPRLLSTDSDGYQEQEVRFVARGSDPFGLVKLSVSLLGEEGIHEPVPPEELDIRWLEASADGVDSASVRTGVDAVVRFRGAPRRALRVALTAGGTDGRP